MKIGILTHELATNYGGILQNYALQQILISMGHKPITLNHKAPSPYTFLVKVASYLKQVYKNIKGVNENLRVWNTQKEKDYIAKNILPFVEKNIVHTLPFYQHDLKAYIPNDLDAIIVGSDQVWNPNYMKPIERFFLSDFVGLNILKISYAASFGGHRWMFNERQTEICKTLLKEFDLITVREDSGVNMCKDHLEMNAHHVLDPTMLLDSEHYRSLLKKGRIRMKKSMMVYILDNSIEKKNLVDNVAYTLGLEINSIMPKSSFRKEGAKGIDKCVFPAVETWIQGFDDADFVVTDSFHGTVFSIIFNKPFITIINRERGADRFTSLLKIFGLDDRLVDVNNNYHCLLNKSIDFQKVNRILDNRRNYSISLLNNILIHDN